MAPRGLELAVEPGDPEWAITAGPQLLASAVTNLLNNAFKFTTTGGHVVLRARTNEEARLLIEVGDECGGIHASEGDPFQSFGKRRRGDGTGGARARTIGFLVSSRTREQRCSPSSASAPL